MSVNARSVGDMRTGFTWTGAWVAAILLVLIFAVSLFAMNGGGAQVVDRAPAGTAFAVGDQLSGGSSAVHRGGFAGGGTQAQPIEFGGSVCHQCR